MSLKRALSLGSTSLLQKGFTLEIVVGAVIVWIVPIFVANAVGKAKNRAGVPYGLLLGWLGVLILAVLPPAQPRDRVWLEKNRLRMGEREYQTAVAALDEAERRYRECPHCKERMRSDATVCPHCQRGVEPLAPAAESPA